jgi:flagellar biosynthesis GTPase FlhF
MLDAIKPLLASGLINEDVGRELNEAWESKLNEAREQVRMQLREEFAQKYEHDKNVMVEALDKMITEGLSSEISEFKEERQATNEDRVKAQRKLRESSRTRSHRHPHRELYRDRSAIEDGEGLCARLSDRHAECR